MKTRKHNLLVLLLLGLLLLAIGGCTPLVDNGEARDTTFDLTEQALTAVAEGQYVGQLLNPPLQVQDFSQPSTHPDIDAFSDLHGQWRVIFIGYLHCPDFCPLTLVDYRHVKQELTPTEAEAISFVFISVDAARDTVAKMKPYLANFDPDFIGFALDDATLTQIQPEYGFYYQRRMAEGSQAVYTVDHSTRSYLVDPDGYLRTSFAYSTPPQQIAAALRWYLANE